MKLTVEIIPYISLIWIGIGFFLILIGVFALAHQETKEDHYTGFEETNPSELFAFFLEEEEKKNDLLRKNLLADKQEKEVEPIEVKPSQSTSHQLYDQIIAEHEKGAEVDEIAKKLNIGKGEVKLMLSLYTMR